MSLEAAVGLAIFLIVLLGLMVPLGVYAKMCYQLFMIGWQFW